MRSFTTIFALLLWLSLHGVPATAAAQSPCSLPANMENETCCCTPPPVDAGCCSLPEPTEAAECTCHYQSADPIPLQADLATPAPRHTSHALPFTLLHDDFILFRDSETLRLQLPNLGNHSPPPNAAFLQMWRC